MLSQQENDLLTRVGPGTPCGNLMRSYWQPVALSDELPVGGAPHPVRILGEDLVLFRDQEGGIGLLGIHCPHRGADLSYGRLEDGGLRCIYHGWLFDVSGRCLQQPGEPDGSTFHERIRQTAYPCQERGGLIFAYLGKGEAPLLTNYEFNMAPPQLRVVTKELRHCNYLQANEGNFDPQHLSILHRTDRTEPGSSSYFTDRYQYCHMETEDTSFGVRLFTVIPLEDEQNFVTLHNFVMPNLSSFGGSSSNGYGVNWCVPIDDTNTWIFRTQFDRESLPDPQGIRAGRADAATSYHRARNMSNRYLQDRVEMKERTFAGLGYNFADQDACVTETEGPIQDRSTEMPGYGDRCILAARIMLLRAIKDVQAGRDPVAVVRDPALNQHPEIVARSDMLPASVDWRTYWKQFAPSNRVPATA